MKSKGAVACGHEQTANAAARILTQGGNAFDAVVAAHFAACVAEPVLASLGGGGFLTAQPANGDAVIYDFFAQTPSSKQPAEEMDFYPITADFGETTQEFHIGLGSIAVPGSVKGMFSIHRDLCTLPMTELMQPAIQLATDGVVVNEFQAYIFDIVKPIYQTNADSLALYKSCQPGSSNNQLIQAGELLKLPDFADTLARLAADGDDFFYHGDIANAIAQSCKERGGLLTQTDFDNYQVIKRIPLQLQYRNHHIYTNPPPSSGGLLIAFALKLLEEINFRNVAQDSPLYLHTLIDTMRLTNKARLDMECHGQVYENNTLFDADYLKIYRQQICRRHAFNRGTTHISVIDHMNNVASMTVSNGEGSGYVAPGSGFVLNNMLGEEDLNPGAFHQWKPNQRISSMMAPTIIYDNDGYAIALGSGGSNRLRTAILQVILNIIDHGCSLTKAVESPRIHFENQQLNIEPGIESIAALLDSPLLDNKYALHEEIQQVKHWSSHNLFFGGVHCVMKIDSDFKGAGDPRRGGVSLVV